MNITLFTQIISKIVPEKIFFDNALARHKEVLSMISPQRKVSEKCINYNQHRIYDFWQHFDIQEESDSSIKTKN